MNMKNFICIMITLFISINAELILSTIGQTSDSKSSAGFLMMEINSVPGRNTHNETEVNVTKSLTATGSELVIKYDIETPQVNDFDFVLALDSSASIAASNGVVQAEAINVAVPNFINQTLEKYRNIKNFNLSIISWNDKIDFAYSRSSGSSPSANGFKNIDSRRALPGSLEDVAKDLTDRSIRVFSWPEDKRNLFKCLPTAHTDLSVAIQASMDILNNSERDNRAYKKPVKFIILVTGESEYTPCSEELITAAKNKGYSIYAIEMQPRIFEDQDSMLQHLRKITGDIERTPWEEAKTLECPRNTIISPYPTTTLSADLEVALSDALSRAISEPAATDVVIRESFYDYIDPARNASAQILGKKGSYVEFPVEEDKDNGTIYLSLPYGLPENNTTKVIVDCNFVLRDLPISASYNSAPVVIASKGRNVSSSIHYTWLKTHTFDKPLPEIRMDLKSVAKPLEQKKNAAPNSEETPAKSAAIESGLLTVLIFMALFSISRYRR